MVLVQYLRLKVSIERVATYLSEPEVDVQVSSLKQETLTVRHEADGHIDEKIGIENGFFLWSEPVEEVPKEESKPKKPWYRRKFWAKGAAAEATPAPEVSAAISNPSAPPTSAVEDAETVETSTIASGMRTPATASAITKERRFQLRDINVIFPDGELTIVTGATASGKTALLRALLGEMYTMTPPSAESSTTKIHLPKYPTVLNSQTGLREYISYAAQTPWLEQLTIKQNILFGSDYNEKRYKDVVECCALKPDLDMLEDGDETEIGERGVSLSGGQKARSVVASSIISQLTKI
jgi:ABC-type transport system involved in cytochrome bd biosynthesis fused ATPase/permease subunit